MKILCLFLAVAAQGSTLRYWIEPCAAAENVCHAGDPELAQWAMEAWQQGSGGKLTLEKAATRDALPACAACHVSFDPLGLPFERYDAMGQRGVGRPSRRSHQCAQAGVELDEHDTLLTRHQEADPAR